MAGQRSHYQADQYRSPYLRQDAAAGRRDPISRWVRYFSRRATLEACEALQTLAIVCGMPGKSGGGGQGTGDERRGTEDEGRGTGESVEELAAAIEAAVAAADDTKSALDDNLAKSFEKPLAGFARSASDATASTRRGCLVVNPGASRSKRTFLLRRPTCRRWALPGSIPMPSRCRLRSRRRGGLANERCRSRRRWPRKTCCGTNSSRSISIRTRAAFGRSATTTAAIPAWRSRSPCGCPMAASPRPTSTIRSWRPTSWW